MDAAPTEAGRRKRKSRSRGLRKTTGCLTCRKRHLKCDEATPSCSRCSKSSQNCVYAAAPKHVSSAQPTIISPPASSENQSPAQGDEPQWRNPPGQIFPVHDQDHHNPETQQTPFRDNESAQAANDLLHLNAGESYVAFPQILSPVAATITSDSNPVDAGSSVFSAPTPPDAAFFRWFGLLAGDADYDLEGLDRRTANETTDLGDQPSAHIPASWPFLSQRSPNGSENRQDKNPEQRRQGLSLDRYVSPAPAQNEISGRQPWHGSEPTQLRDHERILFTNFVNHVSSWIDLLDPTRCFSTSVPHLAMHDAGLMNAVLALSARHLSLSPIANDEQRDRNVGLQYYYETLHYLQKAMRYDSYTTSLELLATALIVSTYEMLDENNQNWERHLKGVFWIQRSQVIQGESGGLKQAVWWAWLRQDVWAAFRERRKTFSFWTPTRAYKDLTPYELASRSIWLFARAVDYSSTEEVDDGERNIQARIDRADRIFEMLEEWKTHLTVEFEPLPVTASTTTEVFTPIWIHPPAFGVAMQLHYSARILLLLHKPSLGGRRGYIEQQQLLGKAVDTICGIAMTLKDDASSLMSSQSLFIAGMCIQDTRQREAVSELIDICQRRTGWPTRSLSEELRAEWQN